MSNENNYNNSLVYRCPILGHMPMCIVSMCIESCKNDYKECYRDLGLEYKDPKEDNIGYK